MKYIKLFEDLDNTYYKIEDQDTFFNKIDEYETIKFNKKEIDTILSFGNEDSSHRIGAHTVKAYSESIILFPESKKFYIVIYKCSDEWYMCAKISLNRMTFGEFYKCDQWDGLMDFIKHEFNI